MFIIWLITTILVAGRMRRGHRCGPSVLSCNVTTTTTNNNNNITSNKNSNSNNNDTSNSNSDSR